MLGLYIQNHPQYSDTHSTGIPSTGCLCIFCMSKAKIQHDWNQHLWSDPSFYSRNVTDRGDVLPVWDCFSKSDHTSCGCGSTLLCRRVTLKFCLDSDLTRLSSIMFRWLVLCLRGQL
jgi:hypothetical protein